MSLRLTKVAAPSNPPTSTGELFYNTADATIDFQDASGNLCRIAGFAGDFRTVRTFYVTTTGTTNYAPTPGTRALYVECVGGGGGGGTATTANTTSAAVSGGGGGGSYSATFISTIKSSYTLSVGTAGPGTGAGNDTTFDSPSVCTGKGGSAGSSGSGVTVLTKVAGGAGGVAGTGDITFVGSDGDDGIVFSTSHVQIGGGGSGFLGAKSKCFNIITTGDSENAGAGKSYGGGGGGAGQSLGVQETNTGQSGFQGVIRITEFS